jgi:death-on-curing protein
MPRRWTAWDSDLPDAAGAGPHRRACEAAASRPGARAFGADAYQDLETKAAALLHSLARNRALVDGNKRLALAALVAFYGVNGRHLPLSDDEAYDLVMQVAVGQLDSVSDIAAILAAATRPRR